MMSHSERPADDEVEFAFKTYTNMLFKLCFTILGNAADAEDAVSDTMLRYMTKSPPFENEEHKKAWLITVATNICRSVCRFRIRRQCVNIDDIRELAANEKDAGILEEVMSLPPKYKTVLHLHYIEGYRIKEISKMLSLSESAVKKRLQYARQRLKIEYGKEQGL